MIARPGTRAAYVLTALLALSVAASATETLTVTDGYNQKKAQWLSAAGKTHVVQSSDNDRLVIEPGYYISFLFSNPAPPDGSVIESVVIYVEHHEDPGFGTGELQWSVGTNWPGGTTWGSRTDVPIRFKESSEGTDAWDVTAWVNDANVDGMELLVQNNSKNKKTQVDHVYAEVTYTSGNQAPVANDDAYSVDEDNTLTVAAPGVLGNDTDAEGDTLTASQTTNPANGTTTLNADGSFTYTPNADFYGTDSFTYVANDGTSDSNEATVTITVNSVVDPIRIDGVSIVEPAGDVPQYEKIELLVDLATEVSPENFYDPDPAHGGVGLSATFTAPGGATWDVPGFYDGADWRVRFAPEETGSWSFTVTATDTTGAATWTGGAFNCVSSSNPGWARLQGNYLHFSDGQVRFAVGHNTGWKPDVEQPTLAEMAANGENLLSFWLAAPWATPATDDAERHRAPIENATDGIGHYNQAACAYIDGVVQRAEDNGIVLLPTIWSHGQLRDETHVWVDYGAGHWWYNNAYNALCSPTNFFDTAGTEQWRRQQNFYRYLIARWGYSRAVAGWVALCEAEGTTAYQNNPGLIDSWCADVADYFRTNDPFRNATGTHPTTASKTDESSGASGAAGWNPGVDLRSCDSYLQKTDDVEVAYTLATETATMRGSGQPAFHAEFGGDTVNGATQPAHLHNGTWGGTSAGAAITPLVWCDGGNYPMLTADMQAQLQNLAEFMNGIDYLADGNLAAAGVIVSDTYCRGWGMQLTDRGFAWVQDTAGAVGGESVEISALAEGTYTVEWYDVWSSGASAVQSDSVTVDTSGVLVATIPPLAQSDIACKFARTAGSPPAVTITAPADGDTFASGTSITFTGSASDPEDGDISASLVWTSDLDGQIGTGASFSAVLSDGVHAITASVTDSDGRTASDTVNIGVDQQSVEPVYWGNNYRWKDVIENVYSTAPEIRGYTYDLSDGATVFLEVTSPAPTFQATLRGDGLKPNFAYQIKLNGKPTQPAGCSLVWADGDQAANEALGYNGRWYMKQIDKDTGTVASEGNSSDSEYESYKSIGFEDTDYYYVFEGYLLFDFVVTDANGHFEIPLWLDSSYHVLWKEGDRTPGTYDSEVKYHTLTTESFGATVPAGAPWYDQDPSTYTTGTVGVYAEHESGRPTPGNVQLDEGTYDVRLFLTEESFHGSDADDGYWQTVMTQDYVAFTVEVNDPPVATDDSSTTDEDTATTITVLANDSDPEGDPLTVTNLTQPANGTATLNADDTVTYTPNTNFNGTDSFTYTANDGTSDSNVATVTVTVNPVNDAPVASDDSATTDEDTSVTVDVLANDSDPDGDALSVDSVGAPLNGTAMNNGDGTVTYTPDPGFTGDDAFTYTVGDGNGGTDTATVTVTVQASIEAGVHGQITKLSDGTPLAGITVQFTYKNKGWHYAGSAVTDSEGVYHYTDPSPIGYPVTYKVEAVDGTWKFEPHTYEVTLTSDQDSVQCDFQAK